MSVENARTCEILTRRISLTRVESVGQDPKGGCCGLGVCSTTQGGSVMPCTWARGGFLEPVLWRTCGKTWVPFS